jgi:hypothetical protein
MPHAPTHDSPKQAAKTKAIANIHAVLAPAPLLHGVGVASAAAASAAAASQAAAGVAQDSTASANLAAAATTGNVALSACSIDCSRRPRV